MKHVSRVLAVGCLVAWASQPMLVTHAQEPANPKAGLPEFSLPERFALSTPARDIPVVAVVPTDEIEGDEPMREVKNPVLPKKGEAPATDFGMDFAVQSTTPTLNIPAPASTFEGLSNGDNATAFGFRVAPPDTDGDVGPNHYVQQVNLLVRVWNKSGVPLTPPFKLSTLFAPLGGQCAAPDAGDPIVLYDPLADRWLLSQFAFTGNGTTPPYHQCIAISKTPDPTGAYYLYDFVVSGQNFPDYPKLGVWPDGYYMTTNQFFLGGNFNGAGFFAFDRQKMLAGDPSAGQIYFNFDLASHPEGVGGALPSDLDGLNPPPVGAPNVFSYFLATEFGDAADGLRLFNFHADFASPALSTVTERPESPIAVAPFNPNNPAGRADIPQPAPGVGLDSITDRLLHRMAYRNFGGHESWVTNHTVNVTGGTTLGTFQAAPRWYDLRRSGGAIGVNDQGTFAPDGTSRWMGSAAMDNQGDLAVGYSVSSSTVFPGIRYAGRLAGDAPGLLAQGENEIVAGTGVQRTTGNAAQNRWGDYSSLAVDPVDDCTFWFTSEYYTAASQLTSPVGWVTRIGSFKFNECSAPAQGTLTVHVTDCGGGGNLQGASITINGTLYGSTDANGNFSNNLPPGTYTVTVSKPNFATASGTVTVTNAGSVTLNLCLTGIPVIVVDSATLNVESCAPPNSAVDPAERVTFDVGLRNTGTTAGTNIVATLLPNARVTAPSGPQNYGPIPAGGTAVRSFSWTAAGSCGDSYQLTFHVQDGSLDLGNVTFDGNLGSLGAPSTFSYTGPPVAIPDNNTTGVTIPILVSGLGNTADVNFRIDGSSCNANAGSTTVGVDHTWVGDLVFKLTSPLGTTVTIINRPGAGTFGSSGNNFCQTLLDDDGAFPAIDSILATGAPPLGPPYTGTFRPENPLSAFDGQNPNGTWRLNVSDNAAPDAGSVRAFSLIITPRDCTNGCGTPRLLVTSSLSRNGQQVSAVITVSNEGASTATNVKLTQAMLGASSGAPLPQTLGNIPVGGSASATVVFAAPPPAGSATTLKVGGTYTGGTFTNTLRVTVP
jgi:subtilisin-like proprotein convertase family protein